MHRALAVLALSALTFAGTVAPATAAPGQKVNDPRMWEFGGVYSCSKVEYSDGLRSYTRPSAVAFVVIKTGRDFFVSDLGDANEGDSTYYFNKDIGFVITCLFNPDN